MKSILFFFIALLCVSTSFLLLSPAPAAGQHHESTHNSKPSEVWYREFPNFTSDLIFYPIEDNDVFVNQTFVSDKYGSPMKNSKRESIIDTKGLYFFKGDIIDHYRKQPKYAKLSPIPYIQSYAVMHRSRASNLISLDDGSKLRWIVGTAADAGCWLGSPAYDTKRPSGDFFKSYKLYDILIDYKERYSNRGRVPVHTSYYNFHVPVLVKLDKYDKILWRKVFLYFYPWWENIKGLAYNPYGVSHRFYYFKMGRITLIDERRLFVYFNGPKGIFRLDTDGNPHTNDSNFVVMDFSQYSEIIGQMIHNIENNSPRHQKLGPCIQSTLKESQGKLLADYDYTGENLARLLGFNTDSTLVRRILRQHNVFGDCINVYHTRIPGISMNGGK